MSLKIPLKNYNTTDLLDIAMKNNLLNNLKNISIIINSIKDDSQFFKYIDQFNKPTLEYLAIHTRLHSSNRNYYKLFLKKLNTNNIFKVFCSTNTISLEQNKLEMFFELLNKEDNNYELLNECVPNKYYFNSQNIINIINLLNKKITFKDLFKYDPKINSNIQDYFEDILKLFIGKDICNELIICFDLLEDTNKELVNDYFKLYCNHKIDDKKIDFMKYKSISIDLDLLKPNGIYNNIDIKTLRKNYYEQFSKFNLHDQFHNLLFLRKIADYFNNCKIMNYLHINTKNINVKLNNDIIQCIKDNKIVMIPTTINDDHIILLIIMNETIYIFDSNLDYNIINNEIADIIAKNYNLRIIDLQNIDVCKKYKINIKNINRGMGFCNLWTIHFFILLLIYKDINKVYDNIYNVTINGSEFNLDSKDFLIEFNKQFKNYEKKLDSFPIEIEYNKWEYKIGDYVEKFKEIHQYILLIEIYKDINKDYKINS